MEVIVSLEVEDEITIIKLVYVNTNQSHKAAFQKSTNERERG